MQEPFGQIRNDHLAAVLLQAVLGSYHSEPVSFEQALNYFPTYGQPKEVDHEAAISADLARVEAWKASGKVIDMRERKKA